MNTNGNPNFAVIVPRTLTRFETLTRFTVQIISPAFYPTRRNTFVSNPGNLSSSLLRSLSEGRAGVDFVLIRPEPLRGCVVPALCRRSMCGAARSPVRASMFARRACAIKFFVAAGSYSDWRCSVEDFKRLLSSHPQFSGGPPKSCFFPGSPVLPC